MSIGLQTRPVTVLVPTYNRGDLIAQSLDSLLSQTTPPRQIIVIDDGSTDRTRDVLDGFGRAIEVMTKENEGKPAALNAGLARAEQPFIWMFDDDDIACADALSHLHGALADDPEAGFSYGLVDRFEGDWPSPTSKACEAYAAVDRAHLFLKLLEDFFIWQGATLMRRECFEAVGRLDERFTRSQDYEFVLRLARRFRGICVPHVLFHQRHHNRARGPLKARVMPQRIAQTWIDFNKMAFRERHRELPLEVFCAVPEGTRLSPRDEVTARLRRGAIMGRKGLWDEAIGDLQAAGSALRELPAQSPSTALTSGERAALRAVFEHGARSSLPTADAAHRLRHATSGFGRHALEVRANLMHPLTHQVRLKLAGEGAQALSWRDLLRAFAALGGVPTALALRRARRTPAAWPGVASVVPIASVAPPPAPPRAKRAALRLAGRVAPDLLLWAYTLARARRARRLERDAVAPILRRQFAERVGEALNLDRPRGLSERLNARKLSPADPLETRCADKLAVRDYVASVAGAHVLCPLLLATDRIADVNPRAIEASRFVVKTNHDYGGVFICTDRSRFDWAGTRAALADRMASNHYGVHREPPYRFIRPRILVEAFLQDEGATDGAALPGPVPEVKVFCFHGEPHLLMDVREVDGVRYKTIFGTDWTRLPIRRRRASPYPGAVAKPAHLRETLELARALSAAFPFVRVDLYVTARGPMFGELTFYPEGGLDVFDPPSAERALGDRLARRPVAASTLSAA